MTEMYSKHFRYFPLDVYRVYPRYTSEGMSQKLFSVLLRDLNSGHPQGIFKQHLRRMSLGPIPLAPRWYVLGTRHCYVRSIFFVISKEYHSRLLVTSHEAYIVPIYRVLAA